MNPIIKLELTGEDNLKFLAPFFKNNAPKAPIIDAIKPQTK